jgi:serine/threonine-protein kinase RsbT
MRIEQKPDVLKVSSEMDMISARQMVRKRATDLAFSLIDQTKLVTATSELARNMIHYGGGGIMTVETVEKGGRRGVRITFEDEGPGIPDVEKALQDGYSTGAGLGLGLGGSRRLANEFEIQSQPGKGTKVVIARWK